MLRQLKLHEVNTSEEVHWIGCSKWVILLLISQSWDVYVLFQPCIASDLCMVCYTSGTTGKL